MKVKKKIIPILIFVFLFLIIAFIITIFTRTSNNTQTEVLSNKIIDIDGVIEGNSLPNMMEPLMNNFIKITSQDGQTEIWEHKDLQDLKDSPENLIYIYILKNPNNKYFFRTIVRYVGKDELMLRNIYIESNKQTKAFIFDVDEDGYISGDTDQNIIESADLNTVGDKIKFIENYINDDSLNITFMGFQKNKNWQVPNNQFNILKESYKYYQELNSNL